MTDMLEKLKGIRGLEKTHKGESMYLYFETINNVSDEMVLEMKEFQDKGFSISASYNRLFGTNYSSIFYSIYSSHNEVSFHIAK